MIPYIGMLLKVIGEGSIDDVRIEGFGYDWIVARDEIGKPRFYNFESNNVMLMWVKERRK